MPVPITVLSTLLTTYHDHELPVCDDKKHDSSCKKFNREHECIHVRDFNPKTGEFKGDHARCFHFFIK